MKNYSHYTAEDFALDLYFQQWVQHPEEDNEQFWQSWLQQHPNSWKAIQEAREMVRLLTMPVDLPSPTEEEEVWKRILATRQRGLDNQPNPFRIESRTQPLIARRQFLAWAASFTGLVMMAGLLYWTLSSKPVQYATDFGQTKTIVLPDGSSVILNAHSTLRLSSDWSEHHPREVWLTGEAFFKVVKKSQPVSFTVHTDDLNVEVLGTQFNVFSREGATRVVLKSGKVKLQPTQSPGGAGILMVPGELAEVSDKHPLTKRLVKPELYSDWTKKQWVLENTPLREVMDRLEATFGMEVVFASEDMGQERMSGVVSTENLNDLIDALATINGLKITQTKSQLYITR
ncbi:MAG: FecR domain-containing protein [Bacteroidota bacterium]